MSKFFSSLVLILAVCAAPCLAQQPDYDMSSFDPNRRGAGQSQFRITPDMHPKHSYQRLMIMRKYGPKGKPVGYSSIKGKAFDYLNPNTLQDKRNKAKATDIYVDNAYEAPSVDKSYDAAYSTRRKSFSSQLKPLGSKHSQSNNPFTNKAKTDSSYSKPFSSNRYTNKFNRNQSTTDTDKSYQNPTVFDDESMF